MATEIVNTNDGTGRASSVIVPDTTKLIFGVKPEHSAGMTKAHLVWTPDEGTTWIDVSDSTIDGEGTTSVDALPNGVEVAAVVKNGAANGWLAGSNF
jgi:hypothetical protein